MLLFIAEKPAMGRAIAKMLPGPHISKDGYIETSGGLVSWCVGHLLETAEPKSYDPKYEKFPGSFNDLPIFPEKWNLQISDGKQNQVKVIRELLKKCSKVVNAGDPGREGQLIIDELLDYLKNTKPVLRILLNSLDDKTIKKELNNLQDNKQFFPLYQAGLGRQRADWLVGMNLSRAYSILGNNVGYKKALSVGRVQSPTLAIVVNRDLEIENFIPKDYWTIKAEFSHNNGLLATNWLPSHLLTQKDTDEEIEEEESTANRPSWLDDQNRIIDQIQAQKIIDAVQGKSGKIHTAEYKRTQEAPPLPFDLSGIQILANSKWGVSVKETLDACQTLYEKGYTSYPRTDCCYLPENQFNDAAAVIEAIGKFSNLAKTASGTNTTIKSRAWNDAKMGEHNAIIPTQQPIDTAKVSKLELQIYEEVAKRFLSQFYPSAEVDKAKIIIDCQSEYFITRGRSIVSPGWRIIYQNNLAEVEKTDPEENQNLPQVKVQDSVQNIKATLNAKKTTPPAHFTQGSLLDAMTKVHLLVSDPAVKKKLKSVEGIGRSATRAAIVETLLNRGFLKEQGKQIISTQVGRALIKALPKKLIDPALTAMWETALDLVATGKTNLDSFLNKQQDWLAKLVDEAKTATITGLPDMSQQAAGNYEKTPLSSKQKAQFLKSKNDAAGEAPQCPKCKKGKMVSRTIKAGDKAGQTFLGCTNYPTCKHAENIKK